MRKLLNTYFAISKREFNGLLALVVLIVAIAAVPYFYQQTAADQSEAETVEMAVVPQHRLDRRKAANTSRKSRRYHPPQLFIFDPNTINAAQWQKLGLSARQSAAIINYRAKGGKFRKAEDLQKMYTISEEVYQRILPFARISAEPVAASLGKVKAGTSKLPGPHQALKVIELNSADSVTLLEIRGIGPAFASRIIGYRQRIGGFSNKEQLMEVFGLDSIKFNEIKDQLSLDLSGLKKIDINKAQIEDFKNHPYIRYKQANAIIQYRKQHGNFAGVADLTKVLILDPETIARLAPYLIF